MITQNQFFREQIDLIMISILAFFLNFSVNKDLLLRFPTLENMFDIIYLWVKMENIQAQ